jgi:hypothetical protein
MLAIEHCLFTWLVELAGNMDIALSLIRSGHALYLEFNGSFPYRGSCIETPRFLKDMFEASKNQARGEIDASLRLTKDTEKANKVASAIRLLVYTYEDKDRPTSL